MCEVGRRENAEEETGQVSARFLGWLARVCEGPRGAVRSRGGKRGHISRALRGGVSERGLSRCAPAKRRWMCRTVNETMPLTTFGTDNGANVPRG